MGGFYYPGDVFGLEMGHEHQYSAEALSDCRLESISSGANLGENSAALAEITRQELRKASEHVMLLGRKTARERLASFLIAQKRIERLAPLLAGAPADARMSDDSAGVIILAGGAASRLPGKLALEP